MVFNKDDYLPRQEYYEESLIYAKRFSSGWTGQILPPYKILCPIHLLLWRVELR